ncbi:MAG: Nif11-like leader peptide family natural product precursor [Egibacteraceae bacterium]
MIEFLLTVAARPDILDSLKVKSKDEVIAAAAEFGFPFTESEFNSLIWDFEVHLASRRGEEFDAQFPLWRTMWGKYYLEFLVIDLIPSLDQAGLLAATTGEQRDPRKEGNSYVPTRAG